MQRSDERAQFLGDIITAAIEGGVNFWAQVSQYQYEYDGAICVCVGKQEGDEPRAVVHPLNEDETGYEEEGKVITLDVVARGVRLILTGEHVNRTMTECVRRADRDNDAGNIDAYDASAIVQAGLFGKVIYG